jgi:WD40 repeat protein
VLTSVALLGGHGTYVRRAAFSMDGSRFLLACSSGRIAIYTRDGELVTETVAPPSGILKPLVLFSAWSADDAHVATIENGTLRLRSTVDLAVVAERDSGSGPVAFCDGGRLLAFGAPDRSLHIFDVPGLGDRGGVPLESGDYQVFDIDDIATDPTGTFVASSDNGGYSENEIGGSAGHGLPKVTIIDPHTVKEVCAIEQGRPSYQL